MTKTIMDLLADSFCEQALYTDGGKLLLPGRVLAVMGTRLKGEYFRNRRCFLIARHGDRYFGGAPMWFCGDGVLLPPRAAESLRLVPGDMLACHYNGVGDYLTVRRSAY